jgi:hypothetical protein
VTGRAQECALALVERDRAHRAAKEVNGRTEHRGILAAHEVIRNDEVVVVPAGEPHWLEEEAYG